ncbi:MAG TPA: hypothetical protein VJQ08_06050 [Candidatus Dormibacteraeota bacterium]|nr:hypothetical protein [Candidatus Dormibacteraeota bacterium]
MRRRLELRDLRSLERRSMYSIFHPLDPNERLPRELLLEGMRWYERLDWPRMRTVVGALYLPALFLLILALDSLDVSAPFAFAIAGAALVGVLALLLVGRTR